MDMKIKRYDNGRNEMSPDRMSDKYDAGSDNSDQRETFSDDERQSPSK
jgi:hypothetical protein